MEEDTLKKYLLLNDIAITDRRFYYDKEIYLDKKYFANNSDECTQKIKKQLILINAVHKVFMKYDYFQKFGVKSVIGKDIEKLKVDVRRLRNSLINIQIKNSMDEFIFSRGNIILSKAIKAIEELNTIDYVSLVKRAMKKNEICLGIVDESNLRIMDRIEIGTIGNIYYNLVEDDIYTYLRKIKSRNDLVDIDELIDFYIEVSNLNNVSKQYIKNSLLIPRDTIKIWKKYLKNRKNYESSYYLSKISYAYKGEITITGGEEYE